LQSDTFICQLHESKQQMALHHDILTDIRVINKPEKQAIHSIISNRNWL